MTPRRTLTFVIIALIVGAALAVAVALAQSPASSPTAAQTAAQSATAAQDLLGSTTTAADASAADPAKQEPVLDSFSAKDPFIPLVSSSGGTSGTDATGGTGGSTATAYEARILVNGSASTVQVGDKVPSGDPVFDISAISSGDVTFKIIDGQLENGDTTFSVGLGETVKVKFEDGASYTLKVTAIAKVGAASGVSGHTISVLSITTQDGKAVVTLEVDGKTYPDQVVGAVINTSWGQIKILAISPSAQTVTIMHGDQTITIHAGQVIAK